ncbi:hypothetical protein A6V39_04920 [Candidatus Mycoplasma haematobovis]|uniref:Uncharacterized protein n=1 Tax=Candidatus Mycoplasma haematobovis TaxID=432608 RepID=A0A1A9QCR4_9MOLU|nr:hypothetical protein [Candidatus Mycoplasma haematobovis]OAL09884.1 hypothetical protein A6V39_04920 [Candidatus Mycoplasma haematobovis]
MPKTFTSSLRKELYLYSSKYVFLIAEKEVKALRIKKSVTNIGGHKYQIFDCPWAEKKHLLVKVEYDYDDPTIEYEGNEPTTVRINGIEWELRVPSPKASKEATDKELKVAQKEHELFLEREEQRFSALSSVQTTVKVPPAQEKEIFEPITAPKKDLEVVEIQTKDLSDIPSVTENVISSSKESVGEETLIYENNPNEAIFQRPTDYSRTPTFWFTLNSSFKDTDLFWSDLREYWFTNVKDLNKKLKILSPQKPPVFTRKEESLNLEALHETFDVKISKKIETLRGRFEESISNLKNLEEELLDKGLVPVDDPQYQKKAKEKNELEKALNRAKNTLDNFSYRIKELDEKHGDIKQRAYLDIHGSESLIAKIDEEVTAKLIDLNLEVNSLHDKHLELESTLIRHLTNLNNAKFAKAEIQFLEQQELIEQQQEETNAFFDAIQASKRKEALMHIGDLHEASANVQEQIEAEKRRAQEYIDNLKSIPLYDNYKQTLIDHKQDREDFRRRKLEFNRYFFKLKNLVNEKERKFNDFFDWIRTTLNEFQNEVSQAYSRNDILLQECVQIWWDRWNNEALPVIDKLFTRQREVVEAFSSIPSTCVAKIYLQAKKLLGQANKRQKEWERIFGDIQEEFKKLGYELAIPKASELEGKYIKQLDTSKLKLSEHSQRVLFIPKESFALSGEKDNLIGLDPKTLDDDQFEIIDQVWSKLTPEQNALLKSRRDREEAIERKKGEEVALKDLKENQLDAISSKYETQFEPFEQYTRALTYEERRERYRTVEDQELQLWKDENFTISNAEGEFKDTLFNLSRRLFKNKSVRVVNSEIVFSDDGFVEDGYTEIFSEKDYFIKAPDTYDFDDPTFAADPRLEDTDIHQEPDEELLDIMANIEYPEEKEPPKRPRNIPTLEELAQISIKKYREQRKNYEIDSLKEKMSILNEEVERLSSFHATQEEHLEKLVEDRVEIFDSIQKDLEEIKLFLKGKEEEMEKIFVNLENELNISFAEIDKHLYKEVEEKTPSKPTTSFFDKWFK